jgi:hypothetical protein
LVNWLTGKNPRQPVRDRDGPRCLEELAATSARGRRRAVGIARYGELRRASGTQKIAAPLGKLRAIFKDFPDGASVRSQPGPALVLKTCRIVPEGSGSARGRKLTRLNQQTGRIQHYINIA